MNFILKSCQVIVSELNANFKHTRRLCSSSRSPENLYTTRTHTCGELNCKHVGEDVVLCGWLQYQRLDKFAILRDAYGTVQVIIPEKRSDLMKTLSESSLESVVCIHGQVINRPDSQINETMLTGDIEIVASEYEILNNIERDLPFTIRNYNKAKESTRMRYRYLDLRFPEMQRNLRLRSKVIYDMRKHLTGKGFIEVETPTLFKRTPGGAQEYVVPTEMEGEFYALVQSPQQLKQLLMVGGVDRYFQVARCYRNEGSRPDRQPEFSQLDIEMSFTTEEGMISLVEDLVYETWSRDILGSLPTTPFLRMSYNDAIQLYGCDKPNLASDVKIQQLSDGVLSTSSKFTKSDNPRLLVFPKSSELFTSTLRKWVDDTKRKHFSHTRLHSWKIPENPDEYKEIMRKSKLDIDHIKLMATYSLSPGDLVFMALGTNQMDVLKLLGKIRCEIMRHLPDGENKWNILWVTDFPLFESDENDNLKAMHHPFTQPHPQDLHLLDSNPLEVRGLHYDLVLNGWEIAGGSVRIHSSSLQEKMLQMLSISSSGLQHMLQALDSGAPPHAGIAFGLDRYISLMVNAPSIRDVIAFPKTNEGRDLMSSSPCPISQEELDLYKISVNQRPTSSQQHSITNQPELHSSYQ